MMKQSEIQGKPDKKILFPGCLILYRFPEYETSAKLVLNQLNVETYTLQKSACCGSFLQGKSEEWPYMTAYNLALAEEQHMDIITLCGGCINVFRRFQHQCRQDPGLMERVNERLQPLGLVFKNEVKVCHLLEYLHENLDALAETMQKKIPLRSAMVNPCQIFRPGEIMNFDNPDDLQAMRRVAGLAGVEIIPYSQENQCCGSTVSLADHNLGTIVAHNRLIGLEEKQAAAMIIACGNCQLMLDRLQKEYHTGKPIPGIFLPQLIGLAMGFSAQELRIRSPHIRRWLKNVC